MIYGVQTQALLALTARHSGKSTNEMERGTKERFCEMGERDSARGRKSGLKRRNCRRVGYSSSYCIGLDSRADRVERRSEFHPSQSGRVATRAEPLKMLDSSCIFCWRFGVVEGGEVGMVGLRKQGKTWGEGA